MQKDGSLADRDDVDFEVAAAAFDLFDAYEGALRPFFGKVLSSTTLRWFSVPNAGLDSPVFTTVLERGVRLTNAHVTDIPISEYVLRSVLDHFQQAGLWRDAQQRAAWDRHQFREVAGTTWLIVGLGTIGQAVALRARSLRHASRRLPAQPDRRRARRCVRVAGRSARRAAASGRRRALPAVGRRGPTPGRRRASSTAMAKGSVLVNIARGSLIDESALVAALDRGRPDVAILDVMVTEPLPQESPLWGHPRVVLTPHNSAGGFRGTSDTTTCWSTTSAALRRGEALAERGVDFALTRS